MSYKQRVTAPYNFYNSYIRKHFHKCNIYKILSLHASSKYSKITCYKLYTIIIVKKLWLMWKKYFHTIYLSYLSYWYSVYTEIIPCVHIYMPKTALKFTMSKMIIVGWIIICTQFLPNLSFTVFWFTYLRKPISITAHVQERPVTRLFSLSHLQ